MSRLPGVWHVGIDGTQTVCPVCDSLSGTRKQLEESGREWTCAPCPAHKAHHEKIKQWLEKENAPHSGAAKALRASERRSVIGRKRSESEAQGTFFYY